MKSRELEQLQLVAAHYLDLAKRASRTHPAVLKCTIGQVTAGHVPGKKLQSAELVLAHLASSAIRLATVCEKEKTKFSPPYRTAFYKNGTRKGAMQKDNVLKQITGNLHEHVHFLLRDAVSHEENVKSDMARDRAEILIPLNVAQILVALEFRAKTIRASV
jgi:hypothetical protein